MFITGDDEPKSEQEGLSSGHKTVGLFHYKRSESKKQPEVKNFLENLLSFCES